MTLGFIMTTCQNKCRLPGGQIRDTILLGPLFFVDVTFSIVYYESRKRELKTRPIYECRCDERLKTKAEKSTRLESTFSCSKKKKGEKKIQTVHKDGEAVAPRKHAAATNSGLVDSSVTNL